MIKQEEKNKEKFVLRNPDGSNGKDFQEITDYFLAQPQFRAAEFMGKFWVQIKTPNVQAAYEELEHCCFFNNISDNFFYNNGFDTLEVAQRMFTLYRTKAIFHPLNG